MKKECGTKTLTEGVKPYACASGTATEEGAAVRRLERQKDTTYKALATKKHFLFIAMCMETYGRLGPDFIAFLTTIAEIAAKRNEGLRSVPTTRSMRQQFITRQLRRYMRQLSLVRVHGIAKRIKSATFAVGKSNITGQANQQQMNYAGRTSTTGPPWPHTSP